MKIYLASGYSVMNTKGREEYFSTLFSNYRRLFSYHDFGRGNKVMNIINTNMDDKMKTDIFLDSGAYSAFTQGVNIDIQEYILFIKQYQKHLTVYANLDVIGSPEGTWKNQRRMEKAGLSPLPCYHHGDDISWLKKYLASGYEYIALGGMVPISSRDLKIWLDDLWSNYLTDDKGMPIVKVHGFGLTSYPLMKRYPWYSVDSTSWVMTGRMGGVFVPKIKDGKYNYDQDAFKIQLSSRSPSKNEAGKHLDSISPAAREQIIKYFTHKGFKLGISEFKTVIAKDYVLAENEKWAGKLYNEKRDVEIIIESGLSNNYKDRDELNIMYFLDLEKSWQEWPWSFKIKRSQGFSL